MTKVAQQGGDGLVDAAGHGWKLLGDVAMVVPVVHRALRAAPHLHEAHAALDEARSEQAALGKVGGSFVRAIEAIGFTGGLRLAHHVECLGGAELHLRGEFITRNAGSEP